MDDDPLDGNQFLQALQARAKLWQRVQAQCLTVLVPPKAVAAGLKMSDKLLERHLLKPSPLYKDQYLTLEKKPVRILIENGKIRPAEDETAAGVPMVQIVAEERFYNEEYQPFIVYCIDSLLDSTISVAKPEKIAKPQDDILRKRTSCEEYSEWLAKYCPAAVLEACEREISTFVTSYVIAKGVLPHMIEKVRQLCERVMSRIAQDCPELQARTVREDPRYVPVLAEATESLVLSMAYGKIMVAVLEACADPVKELERRFASRGGRLTPEQVGLSDPVFACDLRQARAELMRLTETRAPVDKRRTWKNVFDLVTAAVNVRCMELRQQVPLTSDELLPLLVLTIVNANLTVLPAELMYLEQFGYLSTAMASSDLGRLNLNDSGSSSGMSSAIAATMDESSYHFVTMQAVLHYLLQGDLFSDSADDGSSSGMVREASPTFSTLVSPVGSTGSLKGGGTVASAMLKARKSVQELAVRKDGSVSSPTVLLSPPGVVSGGGAASGAAAVARQQGSAQPPAPPPPPTATTASPTTNKKGSPALSVGRLRSTPPQSPSMAKREINLPPMKVAELSSEEDVGPLLRKLRGF